MAIIEHKTSDSKNSLNKQIDESSAFLIYEVLQGSMYKYPMYSAVREAVSNSIDSIKEKSMAKEILSGKSSVEEYYTSNGDSSTVDSNFDSEYYDLNYLSDNDTININYNMSNDPSGRDSVSFIDHGVGLGGKRLIGWTKLGYSTKRLSKKLLGGFGLNIPGLS